MMEERDEFGLPIRRAVKPLVPEMKEDETSSPATEATNDVNAPSTPTTQTKATTAVKKENGVTETDSENETFEDARSMAPSEATASPIKTTHDDRTEDTPEPSSPVKETKESLNAKTSLPTDEQPTPKADAAEKDPMKEAKPLEPAETDKPTTDKTITDITPAPESKPAEESATKSEVPIEPQAQAVQSPRASHNRDASIATQTSVGEAPVGAFSHQSIPNQDKQDDAADDDEWQEMPSYARYDMYNDDDKLIARERLDDLEDDKMNYSGLGGAGKGYTRVGMDEDAESATSMDDHTNYLFNNKQSTGAADGDDEQGRDAVSQMQATKDLLTEGQRIAYVGIVRLEVASMIKEREDMPTTKKVKKDTTMAAEATKMWGQRMMIRLYAHMDISEAEQIMIEQLAEHGVVPGDLTPALLTNARVANPMADEVRISEELDKREDDIDAAGQDSPKSEQRAKVSQFDDDEEAPAKPPPPYETVGAEDMPEVKTPSQLPQTSEIEIDLRWTVLCDLFLILIADSVYDSRSRVLLERVGASLEVPELDICRFEKRVTDALEMQQAADKENWNEEEHMESRRKRDLKKRYMMMGLATVGGGLVIGLSAGLLAPVIGAGLAAGFTTIGVGGTSAFLGGVGGAAIITTTAATSGGIVGVRAANRRTGAVKTFEYRPLYNNKRVNLVVTISGWLTGKMDDVRLPFSTIDPVVGDIYSILWEPEMLRSMGDTINILATEALTTGLQQVLGNTFLTVLMAGLQVPVILSKLSYLIDNPWAVSLDRAWSAGQILADSIIERNLGTRPITLVGYSIGARVIFSCLMELAKKGAFGLIQGVYMFGSPIVVKKEEYLKARGVVSGRFVNGYHNNDWILGYLFRLTNGGIRRVAGLAPITEVDFVENVDVTELVKGHMEYRTAMPSLLLKCGWPVESEEFTEIEEPDPENHGQRQRELINEIEEARKELEREGKASQKSKFGLFGRRKKTDKAEWEVYEEKDGEEGSKGGEGRKSAGDNGGVLFDIDAIRAELAKEQMGYGNADEELQIREIKSTLPPMKIDVSPSPSPSPASIQRPMNVRGSQSADVLPPRPSYSSHVSGSRVPSRTASPSYRPGPASPAPPVEPHEEEVQMTFDSDDDDVSKRPPPPPKQDDAYGRPGMKSSHTLPNINLHDPWADPDDEDFGKEKEMTMTFA